jgi:hypothetical protein
MEQPITQFTQLFRDVEYSKPPTIPPLDNSGFNLQFVQSLESDWENFQLARSKWLCKAPPTKLFAEVRALDARKQTKSTKPIPPPPASDPTSSAHALATLFNNRYNNNWNQYFSGSHAGSRGASRDGFHGHCGPHSHSGLSGRGFHSYGRGKGNMVRNQRKSDYDPDKYCRHCQIVGHDIHVCRKYARAQEEKKKNTSGPGGNTGNNNGSGSGSGSSYKYDPSYVRPYHNSVNVTRFIANSSQVIPTSNSWVIDSAANAYITPFKSDFRFFIEENIGEVRGYGGKLETAYGKGSVTLTDAAGNRITLNDVCYVPSGQDHIISMMKFRREHHAEFRFTGPETFKLTASNGFQFIGTSINDILYTPLSIPQVNAVVTRSAVKQKVIENSSDDELSIVNSEPESDLDQEQPNKRTRNASPSPSNILLPTLSHPLPCAPSNLWHLRYGHASSSTLQKLKGIKSNFDSRTCSSCIQAKKTRRPFSGSISQITKKLGRIHSDICGQYPESKGNLIFNLTFLDQAT